jgi:peptide-methionine (S)-S-oxide reductase
MKRYAARLLGALAAVLIAVAAAPAAEPGPATPPPTRTDVAIFAGGCFWCEEAVFDEVPGVISVTSGYTGGTKANPTYEEVSAGGTGHAESVKVVFDPAKIGYEKLLDLFWHNVDPLTADAQFCDHGSQYRSAIFYTGETQKRLALASKQALEKSGRFSRPIVTQIVAATTFWPAEAYHQNYHRKNPLQYRFYRFGCGRDRRLEELWGPKSGS